jgi:hypothetical protein
MEEQNFKNHARLVPMYHIVLFLMIVAAFVISVLFTVHYFRSGEHGGWYAPITLLLVTLGMMIQAWYSRAFAARAQDRAIRAEENLRHFALTGKLIDPRVTMDQVVALRFAPDDEFLRLIDEAINKQFSNEEIKQRIKKWKADHYRA